MNVLADLGAGADRGPSIDHRALVDVGADVDVGGHEHCVFGDERTLARDRRRHDAVAAFLEILRGVVGEFRIDFVEVAGVAAVHDVVVFQTKRQQHGFLDPLVRHPFAVDFFRDTDTAAVEIV